MCKLITTKRLGKQLSSQIIMITFCVCVVRIFKTYSFSNFQIYNIILLTINIILYIRSPIFIQIITEVWPISPHFTHPQLPVTSTLCIMPWRSSYVVTNGRVSFVIANILFYMIYIFTYNLAIKSHYIYIYII